MVCTLTASFALGLHCDWSIRINETVRRTGVLESVQDLVDKELVVLWIDSYMVSRQIG